MNIFRFGSHAWIFLFRQVWCAWIIYRRLLISTRSVCLNSSGIVRLLLSCELARLEFSVLVILDFWLGSKLPCLFPCLFYFLVRFRFLRTPCCFFSCFVSRGRVSFLLLFLVDAVPFLFLFCFVLSDAFEASCDGLGVGCLFSFWFKLCILMWSRTKSYGRLTGYLT